MLTSFNWYFPYQLLQTKVSSNEFHGPENLISYTYPSHGVVPAELDQKLCHLLIEQQEHQIGELESELNVAQSKLNEKEAELQALKDCVRRLTEFSLTNASGKIILISSCISIDYNQISFAAFALIDWFANHNL